MRFNWSDLRLRWFMATHALGYGADFTRILYRIYLGHDKVIHYRRGHPVASLTTPALFSRPSANFLSRILYRGIQNRNLPNMVSLAVNDVCDAGCEHCSFFAAVEEPGRHVLSGEEMVKLIADAQELGVSVINFVGGEPLLREDLPDLIRAVDKDLSTTVLFTNGSQLEVRAKSLAAAGLDSVFVSIDAADPAAHDGFRRAEGLFDKALAGIRRARQLGMSTGFSVTMTPESWAAGELDRIMELAKREQVHEVLVFDALPTGRYAGRTDLVDNHGWVERMMQGAARYHRDAKAPGLTFFAHVTSHRSVGCSCGTSYFYVSPYGDIMSCDFNHARFGNVLEAPLWQLWEGLTTRAEFCRAKWGGCKVQDSEFRKLDGVAVDGERRRMPQPGATASATVMPTVVPTMAIAVDLRTTAGTTAVPETALPAATTAARIRAEKE